MNIVIFTDTYTPVKNGVVTSVTQLKSGLEDLGHRAIIVTLNFKGAIQEDDVYRTISIPSFVSKNDKIGLFSTKKIIEFLEPFEIDLVHIHTEFSMGIAGRKIARELHLPLVCTAHTMWLDYIHYLGFIGNIIKKPFLSFLKKHYLAADVITTPSIKSKNFLYNLIHTDNIRILPNGIDKKNFLNKEVIPEEIEALKKSFGIQDDERVVISVGRVGEEKRIIPMLDIFKNIIKTEDKVKFIVVGDGPIFEEAKEYGSDYSDKINFTGFVEWKNLYKYYPLGDVFITVSLSETHSMTMIEAMLSGVPIIARNDDSFTLLVENGKNGYLCESDEEVKEKIINTIFDDEKLQYFSTNSKEIADSYSAENHIKMMLEAYHKAIEVSV